jgi:SpoVK/Ycf46/Vps4 family AAA+-type ATPase
MEDIKLLIRTRHAIVTIETVEESFAARTVREAGGEMGRMVLEWSISDGLRSSMPTAGDMIGGTDTLLGALKYMRFNDSPHVYTLKDALRHLSDAKTERVLRDMALESTVGGRTVFMIDPGGELPQTLQPLAVPYDLALPDQKEITQIVRQTAKELTQYGSLQVELTRHEQEQFISNLRGLTRREVAQVVADALLGKGKLSSEDIARAVEAKRARLRQTGVLDYIPPPETLPSIGGMDNLRKWLSRRADAWSSQAKTFGLDLPKGMLMLGVQGCGKSLMARFVAAEWKMPLLRLDVGALYDKYVGETERHLRTAFAVASAMAPCVLWIDEIEKAFAGAGAGPDGARTDGGLSQRMFGMLLTWMQDHKEPVFIVATANDVSALPPELMRKGRFDEIFFVDLPDGPARQDIFIIHLTKRQRDPKKFDLDGLVASSEGFSGAEIEQAVVSALYTAFAEKRDLTSKDLLEELQATRPLSVVMAEKVSTLRAWAADRCVRAD